MCCYTVLSETERDCALLAQRWVLEHLLVMQGASPGLPLFCGKVHHRFTFFYVREGREAVMLRCRDSCVFVSSGRRSASCCCKIWNLSFLNWNLNSPSPHQGLSVEWIQVFKYLKYHLNSSYFANNSYKGLAQPIHESARAFLQPCMISVS